MPNYRFVTYNDLEELEKALDDKVAAFILEPIQGEGGVRLPSGTYLSEAERMCRQNGSLLIEFGNEETAQSITHECLSKGLITRRIQGTGIRIFPPLTISKDEMAEGLGILEAAIQTIVSKNV